MIGVFEFIEDYLIRDLQSMRGLKSQDGLGKCGYQMMVSICTGCELLGALEKNDFSENSETKFKFFINHHLPTYNFSWDILFHFIRNRIAHDFITPPNVLIRLENDRERHLGVIDEWYVIDAYIFMDDFISAYEKLKQKYNSESNYKEIMDIGYKKLIEFMMEKTKKLNEIITRSHPKTLPYPQETIQNDTNVAVPSGAAFDFGYENITRIPNDMLEKINLSFSSTPYSGASGSVVKNKDIKPFNK